MATWSFILSLIYGMVFMTLYSWVAFTLWIRRNQLKSSFYRLFLVGFVMGRGNIYRGLTPFLVAITVLDIIFNVSSYRKMKEMRRLGLRVPERSLLNQPEANFQLIAILSEGNHIALHYQLHGSEENDIIYWMREEGCQVAHDGKSVNLNGTASEIFFEDFKCILKFQKSSNLHEFFISGRAIPDEHVSQEFLASTGAILKNSGRILKSSEFSIDASMQNLILEFLPYFDPQVLKKVDLEHQKVLQMNEIVELEQWKNLECVLLENVVINPGIEHFLHLNRAFLHFDRISGEELKRVKETLISTPSMTEFYIAYQNPEATYEFGSLVGDPVIFEREEEKRWFFNIPGENDKLLFVFNDQDHDMFFEKKLKIEISEDVELYDRIIMSRLLIE
ncbi:hypothetical protein CAEBREN_19654 [Caenorhabditis brenneri]|uniref:DUF38 domain-containing protein n=1 Tax=Caenorhabditis brenneri TaxID=135651 RepID=G0NIA7_CAEBE|nr:hypothetical protein CAEBREN_19654 [Caenorhabditis brenneri]